MYVTYKMINRQLLCKKTKGKRIIPGKKEMIYMTNAVGAVPQDRFIDPVGCPSS
jgi:hypothetical protein